MSFHLRSQDPIKLPQFDKAARDKLSDTIKNAKPGITANATELEKAFNSCKTTEGKEEVRMILVPALNVYLEVLQKLLDESKKFGETIADQAKTFELFSKALQKLQDKAKKETQTLLEKSFLDCEKEKKCDPKKETMKCTKILKLDVPVVYKEIEGLIMKVQTDELGKVVTEAVTKLNDMSNQLKEKTTKVVPKDEEFQKKKTG